MTVVKRAEGKRRYRQKRRQKKAAEAARSASSQSHSISLSTTQKEEQVNGWPCLHAQPSVALSSKEDSDIEPDDTSSPDEATYEQQNTSLPLDEHSFATTDGAPASDESTSLDSDYLHSLGLLPTRDGIPDHLMKYWRHRYSLFSLYDQGIMMDEESWYSVTPEKIAEHIASRCDKNDIVVDAFCGAGGNAIQFALQCQKVIAIDIDPVKIACAKHNAYIYGVQDKIEFIYGDCMKVIPSLDKVDVIFLSPPWGGPEYLSHEIFDITCMTPNGIELYKTCRTKSRNIIYYLPRNTDPDQVSFIEKSLMVELVQLGDSDALVEIEQTHLNDRLKCLTAFYGNTVDSSSVI